MTEPQLIQAIARRAVAFYERMGTNVLPVYIATEISYVHNQVIRLRLQDMLDADDFNFMHDIAGIHRHLDVKHDRLNDCFLPRFAVTT